MKTPLCFVSLGVFLFVTHAFAADFALPAFPGAEGFGATTPGGRGGKVLFVDNLDDSGPGSFRPRAKPTARASSSFAWPARFS